MIWELRKTGLQAEAERPISVYYDGQLVGAFTADLLVNDRLEFKKKFRVRKQESVSL
ncbi:MAG: hypothetical protein DME92_12225 [Verrucomicrobia bacterium]|nr:MAG: hypothetical protein DME92_12225 [Verrucomicrobiota bacterium]